MDTGLKQGVYELILGAEVVGYRLSVKGILFDIDLEKGRSIGITRSMLVGVLPLVLHNNLYVTEMELLSKVQVEDITNSTNKIKECMAILKGSSTGELTYWERYYNIRFGSSSFGISVRDITENNGLVAIKCIVVFRSDKDLGNIIGTLNRGCRVEYNGNKVPYYSLVNKAVTEETLKFGECINMLTISLETLKSLQVVCGKVSIESSMLGRLDTSNVKVLEVIRYLDELANTNKLLKF